MKRKTQIVIVFCLSFFILISQNDKTYYSNSVKLQANGLPVDSNELYFPKYIFFDKYDHPVYRKLSEEAKEKEKNARAVADNRWYSRTLYLCNEPVLYSRPQGSEILRILVIPSFSEPFCISISDNVKDNLILKILSGQGGYTFGLPLRSIVKTIPKSRSDSLRSLFKHSSAINYKTISDKPSPWSDGSYYIVELISKNKYFVFFRHVEIHKSILEIIEWVLKETNNKDIEEDYEMRNMRTSNRNEALKSEEK